MAVDLKGRNFLTLRDFTAEEISHYLELAAQLKADKKNGTMKKYMEGKNIALIFEKPSTRTRCSFVVACNDMGAFPEYLGKGDIQLGKESVEDTARVLGRMFDGIEFRGFSQKVVEDLAKYSSVPVWNGLTNEFHPTQMLADVMTIEETFGHLKGINMVFIGDARNNVGNSLMVVSAKMGINFTVCAPSSLWPSQELVNTCKNIALENGSTINLTEDVMEGTKNADVIYTDVWVSMGEPDEVWKERINLLKQYQVNKTVMNNANPNAIFLHCLPSFHDLNTKIGKDIYEKFGLPEMEVSNEVFESNQSKVFEEAENRMHTIKAVIYATMKDNHE